MRYRWMRLRSWWYWRRFEKPGRTVTEQAEFARRNLGHGPAGGWL